MVAMEESAFKAFSSADSLDDTLAAFHTLCENLKIPLENPRDVYRLIKSRLQTEETQRLYRCLDKRASGQEYMDQAACKDAKVFIIGAGPCGLRMAIECALLGAEVMVVEKRKYISRNNVLHLWPFVISDLKALGIKVFHPKFCVGALDHVSIRKLQLVLLKISLVLGVRIYVPTEFVGLREPDPIIERGWTAEINPPEHPLNNWEFNAIIGADGKANTLTDFKRKCFRGQLAIGITANFINHHTREEAMSPELGGIMRIFDQPLFHQIKQATGLDLENIVYFKDETHYFVMTAKKSSLIQRGIVIQQTSANAGLLKPENVSRDKLLESAYDVASFLTGDKFPLDFATDHHGQEDSAIFDFTAMYQAEHSCFARERHGKRLLLGLVGDTLLEPFWPTGSGCARGFLGVMDAAWLIRGWFKQDQSPLELLAERENTYQQLSQTSPRTLSKAISKYTIDPKTRYGVGYKPFSLNTRAVKHLIDSDGQVTSMPALIASSSPPASPMNQRPEKKQLNLRIRTGSLDTQSLLRWYQAKLGSLSALVEVTDLLKSWKNGLALCAILQVYRPHLMDARLLSPQHSVKNIQTAFDHIEQEFGISPYLTAEEMAAAQAPEKLAVLSYLAQLQDTLDLEPVPAKQARVKSIKAKTSAVGMMKSINAREAEDMDGKSQKQPSRGAASRRTIKNSIMAPQSGGLTDSQRRKMWRVRRGDDKEEAQPPAANLHPSLARCRGKVTHRISEPIDSIEEDETSHPDGEFVMADSSNTKTIIRQEETTERESAPDVDLLQNASGRLSATSNVSRRGLASMMRGKENKEDEESKRLSVSELTAKINKSEENSDSTLELPGQSDKCCVCGKKLFIIERCSNLGFFFHKQCYRCAHCDNILKPGDVHSKKLDNGKVEFYCTFHALSFGGVMDVKWEKKVPLEMPDSGPDSLYVDAEEYVPHPSDDEEVGHSDEEGTFHSMDEFDLLPSMMHSLSLSLRARNSSSDTESDDTLEEEKDEEEEEEDEEPVTPSPESSADKETGAMALTSIIDVDPRRIIHSAAIKTSISQRMLMADELQQSLSLVESRGQALEERGQEVEQKLRTNEDEGGEDTKLMDQWLDVLGEKKQLEEEESKIMLQVRLMELQERHMKLQMHLKLLGAKTEAAAKSKTSTEQLKAMVDQLENDTEAMEKDVARDLQDVSEQYTELDNFFSQGSSQA